MRRECEVEETEFLDPEPRELISVVGETDV